MEKNRIVRDFCDGLQHVGLPTKNLDSTVRFYQTLGFEAVHKKTIIDGQQVCFLKFADLMLEAYEEAAAPGTSGAIDHLAINCTDLKAAYRIAVERDYTVISDGIEELPFWENGVRFFIIQGPNGEKIEFNQRL